MTEKNLLHLEDLKLYFRTTKGAVRAVDGVTFDLGYQEAVVVLGESGCGKSVTSFSILRLVGAPGKIDSGEILFEGRDLLKLSTNEMTQIRGNRIAMIFQQPTSALNPVFTVSDQITEVLKIHQNLGKKAGLARALELLKMVGISDPQRRLSAYPFELSGGMAQRVMIAMGLACIPDLLIADEPTTALDVTIQAQILDLMRDMQSKLNTAIILITHDLGVVAEMADRIAVMYAGQIVEEAPTAELFRDPRHPYTQGLIASIPVLGEIKGQAEARVADLLSRLSSDDLKNLSAGIAILEQVLSPVMCLKPKGHTQIKRTSRER